ncbi:hypothetical protein ACIHDR_25085 [Nocardia sp. NPDC052278]|uniref:AMP-binding enzyme n=1 Tax=unclassified Nocardia TaxID=2637762 RepID=UPI0036C6314D
MKSPAPPDASIFVKPDWVFGGRTHDGAVRISGRAKDIIVRGGENIPVVEIENALFTHPDIEEVAVVGYADDRLGERACAVVVPLGEPPTLSDVTRPPCRTGYGEAVLAGTFGDTR